MSQICFLFHSNPDAAYSPGIQKNSKQHFYTMIMLYHPWSNQKENLDDKDCEQVFKFNFHTISKNIEEFSKIPDETIFRFMENADSRDNASRSNTDTDEEEINDEPADGNTINDFRSYLLFENMANFDNNRSSASSSSSTFTSTDGGSVARTIIS